METVTYQAVFETRIGYMSPPRWVCSKAMFSSVEELRRHFEKERKRVPDREIRILQVFKVRTIAEPVEIEGLEPLKTGVDQA